MKTPLWNIIILLSYTQFIDDKATLQVLETFQNHTAKSVKVWLDSIFKSNVLPFLLYHATWVYLKKTQKSIFFNILEWNITCN